MGVLVILGGGAAGLSTAFFAQKSGRSCLLIEKEPTLGGLCRTVRFGRHRYDLGAHRFHDRIPAITAEVSRLLNGRLHRVTASSKIYRSRRFIDFPPTPKNLLTSIPPGEALLAAWDLFKGRLRARPVKSFEDYAVNRFGKSLARNLLIDYSQKLWGLPANQLSPAIATRRLSGMTVASLLLELLPGSRKTAHIDGHFLYPEEGFGAIVEALAQQLAPGAALTGTEVMRLEHSGSRVDSVVHRAGACAIGPEDTIVSTLPLGLLARILEPALEEDLLETARRLKFRHIRLIYFRLNLKRLSEFASIYVSDPTICVTRITEPKNRSSKMAPLDETGIAVETPCFAHDEIYRLSPEDLVKRVAGELESHGLLDSSAIIDWQHHFLPNAYPVYDLQFQQNVQRLTAGLQRFENLRVSGRQGLFFYSHLHDQLEMGRELAQNLT